MIGIVDCMNFEAQYEKALKSKQVVASDLLLLNKSEEISDAEKLSLLQKIKELNPLAEVIYTRYGETELNVLQNFSHLSKMHQDRAPVQNLHDHVFKRTITFIHPLNREEFTRWLEYTLDVHKNSIYRTKGILFFQNEPFEYFLQGVGGNIEIVEGDIKTKKEAKKTVIELTNP